MISSTNDELPSLNDSDSDSFHSTACPSEPSDERDKENSFARSDRSFLLVILRMILLDAPLCVLFGSFFISVVVMDLNKTYFLPMVSHKNWHESSQKYEEGTYYARKCNELDLTSTNPQDLILPLDATPQQAHDHILKHGASVYRNLVTPETAAGMRKYILRENAELEKNEDKAISLISNKNRWSFRIGADDDPVVAQMLKELGTHPVLRPAFDEIMGDEAAMVELTAITSANGAKDQHWHSDTGYYASALTHPRSFVPMYSLFIPFQDTTESMGATSLCPGSHICTRDSHMGAICDQFGLAAANTGNETFSAGHEVNGFQQPPPWRTGDGLFMNLDLWHRGPKHYDPTPNSERTMLIITFSPRPRPGASGYDHRMLSLGTSYSNRWDMHGFTMSDLAEADKYMKAPWTWMRMARFYAGRGRTYGWDYFSVCAQRIANKDMGFDEEDLVAHIERFRKLWWGPIVMSNVKFEDQWDKFLPQFISRWVKVTFGAAVIGLALYLVAVLAFSISSIPARKLKFGVLGKSVARLAVMLALVGFAVYSAHHHFAASPHVAYVRNGMLDQPSPFLQDRDVKANGDALQGPTTQPIKHDVLFGRRYDDEEFINSHNKFLDIHPGNQEWKEMVTLYADRYKAVAKQPRMFRESIVSEITDHVRARHGRFLMQNHVGDWMILEKKDARYLTEKALLMEGSKAAKAVDKTIANLLAVARFRRNPGWQTGMSAFWNVALLEELRWKIFPPYKSSKKTQGEVTPPYVFRTGMRLRKTYLPAISSKRYSHRPIPYSVGATPIWKVGDMTMANYNGKGLFYEAHITGVNENGSKVDLKYEDEGDTEKGIPLDYLREREYFKEGDVAKVWNSTIKEFIPVTIVRMPPWDKAVVEFDETGKIGTAPQKNLERRKPVE